MEDLPTAAQEQQPQPGFNRAEASVWDVIKSQVPPGTLYLIKQLDMQPLDYKEATLKAYLSATHRKAVDAGMLLVTGKNKVSNIYLMPKDGEAPELTVQNAIWLADPNTPKPKVSTPKPTFGHMWRGADIKATFAVYDAMIDNPDLKSGVAIKDLAPIIKSDPESLAVSAEKMAILGYLAVEYADLDSPRITAETVLRPPNEEYVEDFTSKRYKVMRQLLNYIDSPIG